MTNFPLYFSDDVKNAMNKKSPIVALESTIISHGMPYPKNAETAREVENIVRKNGATPATIAILNGNIHVGLNEDQLEQLANPMRNQGGIRNSEFGTRNSVNVKNPEEVNSTARQDSEIRNPKSEIWKVSLRDLPYVVSQRLNGATTVAATMRIASLAGIKIFVTGGIGGVHRGAETTMDISADLTEMSQTNVAVVSAGVKSILDIGLTLEYLETLGVPVVTYGSPDFPSFYSRKSGFKSPLQLDTPKEIADMLRAKWSMGLNGSVMIANPISEEKEYPFDKMEKHIQAALEAAKKNNITGKDTTPFILKYIADATGGESLESNIALVFNNAELGAKIAVAL